MHVIEIENDRKLIGAFISCMLYNRIPLFMHTQGNQLTCSFPNADDFEWSNIELTRLRRVIKDQTQNEIEMMLGIGHEYSDEEKELIRKADNAAV